MEEYAGHNEAKIRNLRTAVRDKDAEIANLKSKLEKKEKEILEAEDVIMKQLNYTSDLQLQISAQKQMGEKLAKELNHIYLDSMPVDVHRIRQLLFEYNELNKKTE